MPKTQPLEKPELLSPEDMERFMTDKEYRAQRRQERLAKLAPPAGGTAIRGYRRDLPFEEGRVPKPQDINPLLVKRLSEALGRVSPLTDLVTQGYDILPNAKSALDYGMGRYKDRMEKIHKLVTDPADIPAFEQGAVRGLEYARDNLQMNLWLMTNIATWRLMYITEAQRQIAEGETIDPSVLRYVGDAITDVGYCLGKKHNMGVAVRATEGDAGLARSLATEILNIGMYAADGHPEVLVANPEIVEMTRQEQEKRQDYWVELWTITMDPEVLGNRMLDEEIEAQHELDWMIDQLYGQRVV